MSSNIESMTSLSHQALHTTQKSSKVLLNELRGCCVFCRRKENEEETKFLGKMETVGQISVHYFCLVLATDLYQRGTERQGFHGFLLPDIKKRLMKVSNTRCSYCSGFGASVFCAKRNCSRVFHYPCGYEKLAMANYNAEDFEVYCGDHRRTQDIVPLLDVDGKRSCVACMDEIVPSLDLLVSPCCRKTYHKHCIRQYAASAGRRNFKCCHCRNEKSFLRCVQENGIFVPELEQQTQQSEFVDHYRDSSICTRRFCECPEGRQRIDNHPLWEIVLCDICEDNGTHLKCSDLENDEVYYKCEVCRADNLLEADSRGESLHENCFAESSAKIGRRTKFQAFICTPSDDLPESVDQLEEL